MQAATVNLILLIKAGFESGVNAQSISPVHRTNVMELQILLTRI